jgi:hypothetical protein
VVNGIIDFIRVEVWAWPAALILVIGYKILTRQINARGMLSDKETKQLSPTRVQLLVLSVFSMFYYLVQVAQNPTQFPQIPEELILLLGGSNVAYLGSKALPLLTSMIGLRTRA